MTKAAFVVPTILICLALQGCVSAVVGTAVGVTGAAVGATAKGAVAVGKAVIPGGGDEDDDRR